MAKELATEEIGWLSLALCVLKPITVEQALQTIAPDPFKSTKELHREQMQEILQLKAQGMASKEIANQLGISCKSVYNRLEKYRKKHNL
jgi:DNA-binding NarL/FixJ family response regulator